MMFDLFQSGFVYCLKSSVGRVIAASGSKIRGTLDIGEQNRCKLLSHAIARHLWNETAENLAV